MKVFVYFNLHKKCFSLKALEGPDKGRVIMHATYVKLRDCTFKVSEAGRQRVLREKKKNVHAGCVGTVLSAGTIMQEVPEAYSKVQYNPYKAAYFVTAEDHQPVHTAHLAFLQVQEQKASIFIF